jgi:hypothetical protein
MAVIVDQILSEYRDASGMRQTVENVVTPSTSADPAYPRAFYHPRTPDVITTRAWLNEGEYIRCFCNPSTTNWSLPRRESFQKTAAGVVRHTWRNRHRGTYLDAFPVTFNFQSGNIMPSAPYDPAMVDASQLSAGVVDPSLPAGLDNFYKFLSLTDQGALGGSQANYHILVYHSRIFPELWLEGWFQMEGPQWTDEGNRVNWTATMLVLRTVPQITNYNLMRGMYKDWARREALSEMLPASALSRINAETSALITAELAGFGGAAASLGKVATVKDQPSAPATKPGSSTGLPGTGAGVSGGLYGGGTSVLGQSGGMPLTGPTGLNYGSPFGL